MVLINNFDKYAKLFESQSPSAMNRGKAFELTKIFDMMIQDSMEVKIEVVNLESEAGQEKLKEILNAPNVHIFNKEFKETRVRQKFDNEETEYQEIKMIIEYAKYDLEKIIDKVENFINTGGVGLYFKNFEEFFGAFYIAVHNKFKISQKQADKIFTELKDIYDKYIEKTKPKKEISSMSEDKSQTNIVDTIAEEIVENLIEKEKAINGKDNKEQKNMEGANEA